MCIVICNGIRAIAFFRRTPLDQIVNQVVIFTAPVIDVFKFMKKYIILPILTLMLASCSLSEPWSQKRIEGIRQAFCVEEMGEQPYSGSCDCFVAATQKNFKTFTAFARSNGPTKQYRDDLLWCGYVLRS